MDVLQYLVQLDPNDFAKIVANKFSYSRMTCNQNNTFVGLILHLLAKIVLLLLLVYSSVPVHNSLIPWSTGTTGAGWVGLLL